MAMASANTSRPQLFALESGIIKKPSDDRGPKLRTEMQHAHSTRTAGVRQVKERAAAEAVEVMLISRGRPEIQAGAQSCNVPCSRACITAAHGSSATGGDITRSWRRKISLHWPIARFPLRQMPPSLRSSQ